MAPVGTPVSPIGGSPISPLAPSALPPSIRPAREPDALVLFWPDGAAADFALTRIQRDFGLVPVQRAELASLGGVLTLFRIQNVPGSPGVDAVRTQLRQAFPDVAVDYNAFYYTEGGTRQYFGRHLSMPASEGPTVPVGIIDTGVGDIAALKGVNIVRKSFLAGADIPAQEYHGTAIASLIAGRDREQDFDGVAIGASLYAASIMRRIGEYNGTSTFMLAQALDWMLAQPVRVINLSLGGPGDELMARMIERVTRRPGLIVVAAAGNAGPDAPPSYPAAYPGVLAVTATNAADQVYEQANRGRYIRLAAPGEDLWVPDKAEGRYVTGTSFAAALVSGIVSRVFGRDNTLSTAAMQRHLCNSVRDLGAPGPDPVFGCGLLQASAALDPARIAKIPGDD